MCESSGSSGFSIGLPVTIIGGGILAVGLISSAVTAIAPTVVAIFNVLLIVGAVVITVAIAAGTAYAIYRYRHPRVLASHPALTREKRLGQSQPAALTPAPAAIMPARQAMVSVEFVEAALQAQLNAEQISELMRQLAS
jgi:hypothetical protein